MTEEITAFDLPVTGRVPAELRRPLPAQRAQPDRPGRPDYHWFLGAGMVHGVRLRDGRAEWYRNRWVRSRAVARPAARRGRRARSTRGWTSPPTRTSSPTPGAPWPRWSPARCPTSSPTSWTPSARATSAGPCPAVSPRTPRPTRATGELHAIAYYWAWDHVQHVVVGTGRPVTSDHEHPGGRRADDARLRAHRQLPGAVRPAGHVQHGRRLGRAALPYTWNPAHPARVGLLPRDGSAGDIRWFEVDPCWVFHTLNAYDDGGRVVIDLCRYQGAYDVSSSRPRPLTLDRWIIDPAAGKVTQQRLDDRPRSSPRRRPGHLPAAPLRLQRGDRRCQPGHHLPERRLRRPGFRQRAAQARPGPGTAQAHEFGRDATAGEAVFVARRPPPTRTTATSWPSCTTPTAAPPTSSSSPPRTSPASLSHASTCPPGSRSASTAAGSRTAERRPGSEAPPAAYPASSWTARAGQLRRTPPGP